jgi:predicted RNA-binding Zn-ribbon protein involved in translation (DUF1610 family)
MKRCHACGKELQIERKVGRSEMCPHCGVDLHACLNCRFYNPGAYNDCTEPQAERVVEKGRSNFCDYFVFREKAGKGTGPEAVGNARSKLDALFKKPT